MPTTTGMKGGGYYDQHSKEQRAALDAFLPWIEEAIAGITHEQPAFMDIGSSEGGNAIYAMERMLVALRRHTDAPAQVFFDDLPTNDFNQLFQNLCPQGRLALTAADIYPAAIGGSAFGPLLPPASLSIATSFNAIGFLEKKPANAPLPGYILPMGPQREREGVYVTEEQRRPYAEQAARDLQHFYEYRATELRPGGKLLLQVFGRDGDTGTHHGIYDVLNDAVLDVVGAGHLPKATWESLIFPIYFRSLDELTASLAKAPFSERLSMERAEVKEVPVPFNQQLSRDGDRKAWVASYTGFLRAFTEAILLSAIPEDLPGPEIVDEVYRAVTTRLAAEPERYEFRYISLGVLLTRSGNRG